MNTAAILQDIIDIARGVGPLLREGYAISNRRELAVQFKGRFDPLTEYDQRAEAHIVHELRSRYPGWAIVGEEGGAYQAESDGPCWHIDPIDGTHNFSHAVPWFCTSIGLVVDGAAHVGVVYDPINERLFAAGAGLGATLNGARIHVSKIDDLGMSLLGTGFPTNRSSEQDNNFQHFLNFMQHTQDVRRLGAAALDLCLVACGWLEGFWQPQLKTYDIAAGVIIVQEAGGRVTDLRGGDDMFAAGAVCASNGRVHDAMLTTLKR
ncbi:MAG: inositol monophosphatase family protein [Chloroflexi bacterium]|nr:inositol monophosphatase family protein [Chloroflexota bacterium]